MNRTRTGWYISVKGTTHDKLKAYAEAKGRTITSVISERITLFLDAEERQKRRATVAANKTVTELGMTMHSRFPRPEDDS